VKPRQRPRPADTSLRPSQRSAVGSNGVSDPPAMTTTAVVSANVTTTSANVSNLQQPVAQQQQQQQQQFKSQPQEPLVLTSGQPPWLDDSSATQPQDSMTSLIDLDPASTLLANLDPLKSSLSPLPAVPSQQFRPTFGYTVPQADLLVSSSDPRLIPGQPMHAAPTFMGYQSSVMPRQCLSYSVHGCGQQAVMYPSVVPYSPLRMMMPQYPAGVMVQGKTGSNNDLHMIQVSSCLCCILCRAGKVLRKKLGFCKVFRNLKKPKSPNFRFLGFIFCAIFVQIIFNFIFYL